MSFMKEPRFTMEDKPIIKPAAPITAVEFDKVVITASRPVLVYFFRKSCHGCQQLAPTIHEIAHRLKEEDRGIQVFTCEDTEVMRQCQVFFVPQLILFHQGQDHWIERGIQAPEGILQEIASLVQA